MENKIVKTYLKDNSLLNLFNLEAFIWVAGIISLFFINVSGESHFTLCPLKNLGIGFCPGCGLGASIHHILHLDIGASFLAHPLGFIALLILIHRIYTLLKNNILLKKNYQITERKYNGKSSYFNAQS